MNRFDDSFLLRVSTDIAELFCNCVLISRGSWPIANSNYQVASTKHFEYKYAQ